MRETGRKRRALGAPAAALALAALLAACGGGAPGEGGTGGREEAVASGPAGAPGETGEVPSPSSEIPRNVLIYLVDTLRADRLGVYGYQRQTSPRLERFAEEAVVFDRAYSNSPWTRTSVVSLFTGLHPETHGVHDKEDSAPADLLMLAELLGRAGFETAGFSSNISVSADFGLEQGFEHFVYFPHEPYFAGREDQDPGYVPVDGMFPAIRDWLRRPHERPFFLYVHTTDPHAQYRPPPRYRRWGNGSADRYDGELLFSDDYFGKVLDLLELQGLLDETLVIFTADHGEELGDHGQMGHGHTLYNELLRVPLLVRHPSLVPARRNETVRLIDLLPTLAEWLGLEVDPASLQGRSILALLRGGRDPWPQLRFVLGQIRYPSKIIGESLQVGRRKLVHTLADRSGKRNAWELYDLALDPGERSNRFGSDPERDAELRARLESLQSLTAEAAHATEKTVLDEETERTLRALGYID